MKVSFAPRNGRRSFAWNQQESWPAYTNIAVITAVASVYVIAAFALADRAGSSISILSVAPVLVAAWLMGARGGVLTAIAMFVVNVAVAFASRDTTTVQWLYAGGLLGAVATVAVGWTCGMLRDLMTKTQELYRQRDQFLSMASHELRTPMASVMGYSELLLVNAPLGPMHTSWISAVHEESQRLTAILDDLLDISRIQSGTMDMMIEPTNLDHMLPTAVEKIANTTKSHTFSVEVRPDTPLVMADVEKLRQVLWNLLSNAVKYSPEGSAITLTASRTGPREVQIRLRDQGVGIAADDQVRLFEPFQRIKGPQTVGVPGTGLGLYIVQSLVRAMGGQVSVESSAGAGSTFCITLLAGASAVHSKGWSSTFGRGTAIEVDAAA